MDEREQRCETCRFWEPNWVNQSGPAKCDGGYGFCHRNPPTLYQLRELHAAIIKIATTKMEDNYQRDKLSDDLFNEMIEAQEMLGHFPTTDGGEWCGEWQPKSSNLTPPSAPSQPPA